MLKTASRLLLTSLLVMGVMFTLTTGVLSPVGATPVNHSPLTAPLATGPGAEEGYTHLSLLAVFGPSSNTAMGDPYSPLNSPWEPGLYSYEYQIRIPAGYEETAGTSIVRVELFDPDSINSTNNDTTIVYSERFVNATGIPNPIRNVACKTGNNSNLDNTNTSPQTYNACVIATCEWSTQTGTEANPNYPGGGSEPPLKYPHCQDINNQVEELEDVKYINPFWYVRVDENRAPFGGETTSYNVAHNTQTRYELFYYRQEVGGTLVHTPLATYFGRTGDSSRDRALTPPGGLSINTDLKWVSPGAFNSQIEGQPELYVPTECGSPNGGSECSGDNEAELPTNYGSGRGFEVDLSQDTPNIETDTAGNRYLNLSITALSGSSNNGFAIWAGPPSASVGLPLDANVRNLWLKNNPNGRSSAGIKLYGVNRLTQTSLATEVVEMPVMFLSSAEAGADVVVRMFDLDTGSKPPIRFYFDTIPTSTYSITYGAGEDPDGRCFDGGATYADACNNLWVEFPITVPATFTGGQLMATFQTGRLDTYAIEGLVSQNPVLSVGPDVVVVEGNTGVMTAVLTVSLSLTSTEPITVSYATQEGTAAAGTDYQAISGTLTFAPGETSQTITVTVLGDEEVEMDETFQLLLSNPVNAQIADGQAEITIVNDDLPELNIFDEQVMEGDVGTTTVTVTVSLSAAFPHTVTVEYMTQNLTAAAGTDYQAITGTLTFAPGETSQTITVTVLGDEEVEMDETFQLLLSNPVNAPIADDTAVITITNDDEPVPPVGYTLFLPVVVRP